MQKSLSTSLGVLGAILLVALLVVAVGRNRTRGLPAARFSEVMSSNSTTISAISSATRLQGERVGGDRSREVARTIEPCLIGQAAREPGRFFLDGGVAPALPSAVPWQRRLGVVVVRYRGAERAPRDARSKRKALEYARSLMPLARTDFDRALTFGDEGSSADIGWVPKNVLEPAVNYVVFTAKSGSVVGPIDTPTGFWIIKVIR